MLIKASVAFINVKKKIITEASRIKTQTYQSTIIRCIFPSFSLAESPPRDLQITPYKQWSANA